MVIETASNDANGAFNALSSNLRSLVGSLAFSRANLRLLASKNHRFALRVGREFTDATRAAVCLAPIPLRTIIVSGSITNAKAALEV